ncbi:DUF4114 domain-containing protein [Corallococcus terminator]
MRTLHRALAVLCLLAAPLAAAQVSNVANLCEDNLSKDKQDGFGNAEYDSAAEEENPSIELTTSGRHAPDTSNIQLQPPEPLNSEEIKFPYDQRVTISYVFESAGASHALGYMYLEDLRKPGREYVNAQGELLDKNENGIFDLHEDLYNLGPTEGTKARTYVGKAGDRRCTVRSFTSDGETYTEPDIARRDCGASWERVTGRNGLADGRPGGGSDHIDTDIVGTAKGVDDVDDTQFSDKGLFPHIPNLLEPADDENGNMGVGQMVFLLADDDDGDDTWGNLAPVGDIGDYDNGIPDYNVTAYDNRGILRAGADNVVDINDRTVDLGLVKGQKEIVFFLIVYYDSNHGPNEGTVYPCLKQDADGKCLLHMRSPISVFFSKAAWNMDQNSLSNAVVAERNIGCPYVSSCTFENPTRTAAAQCMLADNSRKLCGWLDSGTLTRLRTQATYGNLVMPKEAVKIPRPTGTHRNPMPHVIVGAPSTDEFRWILGFEDLPGGGDRDFNDVVFVINKQNGGTFRSGSLTGEIDLSDAEDFVITKVRFSRYDDSAPYAGTCSTPPCWTEATPGACSLPGKPAPSIQYSVAVDCHTVEYDTVLNQYVRKKNENRTWIPVRFDAGDANTKELDLLELGFTGSQLCWKVDITSPDDRCIPVVDNVNVGYQAVRAGSYSRSSPSTVGNAIVWGVNETPGSAWGKNWPGSGQPEATVRTYDNRKDYSVRGRLYLRSLYDPEKTDVTNVVERWDAGKVMAMSFGGSLNPLNRKLYTQKADGTRATLEDDMDGPGSKFSLVFPDSLCNEQIAGKPLYDINGDGKCGTPTITSPPSKVNLTDNNDRNLFREWLYGWEDHQLPGATNVKRPWPMGGINLSTVALAVPPYLDTWAMNTLPAERDLYRRNFMTPLKTRPTVAYVGTMNGFMHAFDSGEFRVEGKDACTNGVTQLRGYFEHTGAACVTPIAPRKYGEGEEKFAYMPRILLDRYRYLYVKYPGTGDKPKPQMDASPTVTNVDFGGLASKWTPASGTVVTERPLKGARTVLVSASGRTSPAIYALDITHPGTATYPTPLWEFNLNDTSIFDAFEDAADDDPDVLLPDNAGSRHAPSVVRIKWGTETDGKWAAVVGTDYKPASGRSGTLYLLDMSTGRPLKKGSAPSGAHAGVITLDEGFGVAGATAMVDLNRDGNYDVMYVPTTAGSVYRINLDSVETSRDLGRQVKTCRVASAPMAASTHRDAANNPAGTAHFQQIHSNIAVKVVREGAKPVVRFYFGTSDNPDEFGDGPPNKENYKYHLMGFEDPNPEGSAACDLLEPLWVSPLDPGQTVWGGVSLSDEKVFTTTAVGTAADVCNLSEDTSGKLYTTSQLPDGNGSAEQSSVELGGHGVSAPVVHDQHAFILSATGQMMMVGDDKWNNGAGNAGETRSRVLVYDPIPDGRLPR